MTTQAPRKYKFTLKKPIHTSTDTKCSICLDDVRFPMSNGCCSYKFCKSCFDIMPQNHKSKCGGCRQNTVLSTVRSSRPIPIYNDPTVLLLRNKVVELNDRITDIRTDSVNALREAHEQRDTLYRESREQRDTLTSYYRGQVERRLSQIRSFEERIESYEARIQSADRLILKHNDIQKYNTRMLLSGIVVIIYQYISKTFL